MRAIWVTFSKEFLEIVRDRRRFIWMLVSSFLISPILFVSPYAWFLSRLMRQSVAEIVVPVQGAENAPALIAYLTEADIRVIPVEDVDALVRNRDYAVGLIVPPGFEEKIGRGQTAEVIVVADRRRSIDFTGSRLNLTLEEYGQTLLKERLAQRGLSGDFLTPLVVTQQNAATVTETAGSLLGLLIPGAIISLGLSAGMPMAIATIAGEKKKLTLEPVLLTTVSRFQLAFAKLLAVLGSVVITLVSMAVSLVVSGVTLIVVLLVSLPADEFLSDAAEAPAAAGGGAAPPADFLTGGYHLQPLAILLFLLAPLLIILFGAALQLLISAWARNDEEAAAYLTPLSMFSGLVIVIAFFLDEFTPKLWHYAIPIFGTILSMRDLLSDKVDPASLTVMFLSSALYAFLMLGLTAWMFHREEIIFRA